MTWASDSNKIRKASNYQEKVPISDRSQAAPVLCLKQLEKGMFRAMSQGTEEKPVTLE